MNRKIAIYASLLNVISVFGFALSMLVGSNFLSYLASLFISFSFVVMIGAYTYFAEEKRKLAGIASLSFACMYAVIICLVYFAQLTTVQKGDLTNQALILLDFQQFSLFFNYDMLGYALMSLSTFFAGLTIIVKLKIDKYLKGLLLIHGVFFVSCLILPMLGLFTSHKEAWIGIMVLEFWCIYFIPVGILSFLYFFKKL